MANQDLCTWCNNYGASTWSRKINNKNQVTKQKFCCLKCKTHYDDRYGIDWIEDKKVNKLFIFLILVIILYFLSQK